MKKGICVVLLLLTIFSICLVSAIDTQINVRTWPNHKASILVSKPVEPPPLLNSFHINSGSTGEVSAVYSGDDPIIKITVKITKDGQTVLMQKFENEFATGSPLYLQVIPGRISDNYKLQDEQREQNATNQAATNQTIVNQTSQNATQENQTAPETTNSTTTNTTETNSSITGAVISDKTNKSSFKIPIFVWYILLGLIVAGIIVFGFIKLKPKMKRSETPHYERHGRVALKPIHHQEAKDTNSQLAEAERKIREAQEEINKIKNKSKMDEIRSRIQKEQDELSRLEKGHF